MYPYTKTLYTQSSFDITALCVGLKNLAGIILVLAYAWACDRSGDTLGSVV